MVYPEIINIWYSPTLATIEMRNYLYIFILLSFGCSSNKAEDKKEPLIIGSWQGFENLNITNLDTITTVLKMDFIITKDSIHFLNYPYYFNRTVAYRQTEGILKSDLFGSDEITIDVSDSILILKNKKLGLILKYKKAKFDDLIIQELTEIGFNFNTLIQAKWFFWEQGTKQYLWKEYDTTIYNPIRTLDLQSFQKNDITQYKTIIYRNDSFKINRINEELLSLELIKDTLRINLDYMDSTTLEYNK
jgi:hypothetical protein